LQVPITIKFFKKYKDSPTQNIRKFWHFWKIWWELAINIEIMINTFFLPSFFEISNFVIEESISIAQESNMPIIVAINKIDIARYMKCST
jgi:hypothetical protein